MGFIGNFERDRLEIHEGKYEVSVFRVASRTLQEPSFSFSGRVKLLCTYVYSRALFTFFSSLDA